LAIVGQTNLDAAVALNGSPAEGRGRGRGRAADEMRIKTRSLMILV